MMTPGPRTYVYDNLSDAIDARWKVFVLGGEIVAKCWSENEARAIAALPELMEALRDADDAMGDVNLDTMSASYRKLFSDAHAKVRIALAKVEGK